MRSHTLMLRAELDSTPAIAPAPGRATLTSRVMMRAQAGVAGAGGPLPHLDTLQPAFGPHDLSGVRAHVGGDAALIAHELGAEAYATGGDVAFQRSPDLHLAAHEAAHVVQQLGGGVSEASDAHEREADAVADAVVAGRSAAPLLAHHGPLGGGGNAVVQRKAYADDDHAQRMRLALRAATDAARDAVRHDDDEALIAGAELVDRHLRFARYQLGSTPPQEIKAEAIDCEEAVVALLQQAALLDAAPVSRVRELLPVLAEWAGAPGRSIGGGKKGFDRSDAAQSVRLDLRAVRQVIEDALPAIERDANQTAGRNSAKERMSATATRAGSYLANAKLLLTTELTRAETRRALVGEVEAASTAVGKLVASSIFVERFEHPDAQSAYADPEVEWLEDIAGVVRGFVGLPKAVPAARVPDATPGAWNLELGRVIDAYGDLFDKLQDEIGSWGQRASIKDPPREDWKDILLPVLLSVCGGLLGKISGAMAGPAKTVALGAPLEKTFDLARSKIESTASQYVSGKLERGDDNGKLLALIAFTESQRDALQAAWEEERETFRDSIGTFDDQRVSIHDLGQKTKDLATARSRIRGFVERELTIGWLNLCWGDRDIAEANLGEDEDVFDWLENDGVLTLELCAKGGVMYIARARLSGAGEGLREVMFEGKPLDHWLTTGGGRTGLDLVLVTRPGGFRISGEQHDRVVAAGADDQLDPGSVNFGYARSRSGTWAWVEDYGGWWAGDEENGWEAGRVFVEDICGGPDAMLEKLLPMKLPAVES